MIPNDSHETTRPPGMSEKVWTPEEREAARERVYDDLREGIAPLTIAIDRQCENSEARELLEAYIHNDGVSGPRVVAWLKRNTEAR